MPIYNDDGTVFELARPNPLMVRQDRVREDFELHNQLGEEVVVSYGGDRPRRTIADPGRGAVPQEPGDRRPARPAKSYRKVRCYCLPIETEEAEDLYGDSKPVRKWGAKCEVECLVVADDSVQCRLWSPREVQDGSIVLVRQDARWWKVVFCREWSGGWLLDCLPSSEKPSFEG